MSKSFGWSQKGLGVALALSLTGLVGIRATRASANIGDGGVARTEPRATTHVGHKSNTKTPGQDWDGCSDSIPTPRFLPLNVTLGNDSQHSSVNATAAQTKALFDAANAECFMGDDAVGVIAGSTKQHDERLNGTTPIQQIRPASHVYGMNPLTLPDGYGFIAADIRNSSGADDGESPNGHSKILWIGNSGGKLYNAVLDLHDFPSTKTSNNPHDIKVIEFGGVAPRQLPDEAPAVQPGTAYARYCDPHAPGCRGERAGPASKNHEGSWVDCTPGCCVMTLFRDIMSLKDAKLNAVKAMSVITNKKKA